jgi:hypothetical protein
MVHGPQPLLKNSGEASKANRGDSAAMPEETQPPEQRWGSLRKEEGTDERRGLPLRSSSSLQPRIAAKWRQLLLGIPASPWLAWGTLGLHWLTGAASVHSEGGELARWGQGTGKGKPVALSDLC